MRRVFAIFFVLLLGLGPLTATLQASEDTRLPACCRRAGAHHCDMSPAQQASLIQSASRTPVLSAPAHCPLYPCAANATTSAPALLLHPIQAHIHHTRVHLIAPACARPLNARLHASGVRGPPAFLLG